MKRLRLPGPGLPTPGLAAFWAISLAAWLALNLLAAIGILALLFALLANASWTEFFREGGNLAMHFLAASPASQLTFERLVMGLLLAFAGLLSLSRLTTLRAALHPAADNATNADTEPEVRSPLCLPSPNN